MLRPKDNDATSSWLACSTECAEDRVAQRRGQVQQVRNSLTIWYGKWGPLMDGGVPVYDARYDVQIDHSIASNSATLGMAP